VFVGGGKSLEFNVVGVVVAVIGLSVVVAVADAGAVAVADADASLLVASLGIEIIVNKGIRMLIKQNRK